MLSHTLTVHVGVDGNSQKLTTIWRDSNSRPQTHHLDALITSVFPMKPVTHYGCTLSDVTNHLRNQCSYLVVVYRA